MDKRNRALCELGVFDKLLPGKDEVDLGSYRTGATSRSRRTTVVVADITIKDQIPGENDTLQVE